MEAEYSILTQDALLWSHTDAKKVPSDPSSPKQQAIIKVYIMCAY